ncbi:MAG: hypothetical protein ACLQUY_02285 [Ktedonobacterales bacterium]
MLHSLYRAYLYSIIVILLFFTAVATTLLLSVFLETTPLSGAAPFGPSSSEVVQSAVFAIISWILTLSVGGLHYWLLRRNEASDGSTANGSVRSVFLNLSEGLAAVIAVSSGVIAINAASEGSDASGSVATLVVFTALFVLLELERRRLPARKGEGLDFQRLHFSGLQLIFLLVFILPSLLNALGASLYLILINTGVVTLCPGDAYGPYCYSGPAASPIGTEWLIVGLAVLAWLVYWVLGRGDRNSNLVKIMHFVGFATGVFVILLGLERGLELLARILLGIGATGSDLVESYDFIPPLVTGLLIVGAYILLLRGDRVNVPERSGAILLTALAIAATLAALPFWAGCVTLLDDVFERLSPGGSNPSLSVALALVFTGLGYIPLELWQRARTRQEAATAAPKRALELSLLAVGMLDAVISLIVLLYATLTAILGNPLAQWQQLAREAASGLVIGAVLVLIYGRQVLAQRASQKEDSRPAVAQPDTAVKPYVAVPTSTNTIESVLDELLAGRISRDQAAEQIRAL